MHGRMLRILTLWAACLCVASGCSPLRNGRSLNPFAKSPAEDGLPGQSITQAGDPAASPDSAIPKPKNPKEDKLTDDLLEPKSAFSPKELSQQVKTKLGMGPNETVAKTLYAEADELFRQAKYSEASDKYEEAGSRWPDSVLEEDAMFMQAESLFFNNEYSATSDLYTNLLKKYENSRYLEKITARQFLIARYWEDVGAEVYNYVPNIADKTRPFWDTKGNAPAHYNAIRLNDPTGPLADDAVMATATHHFLDGRYEDADYYYSLLRKEYPNSEHQSQAHMFGIRAKMAAYQGPQYAKEPLVEADKLIDTTIKQFATKMPEKRNELLEAKSQVRYQLAEREWLGGEYYANRNFYRAANYYYALLVREFPDTPFAEKARQRIEETADRPAEPPNHFLWLGRIFGETGK